MSTDLSDYPGLFPVQIGERTYAINTSFEPYRRDAFRHRSIASQRESINLEGKTGEGTVNTEGLWRVSAFDWSYGAGQLYADRDGSVANRFYQSTGVDVLTTQFQASLLPALKQVYALDWQALQAISLGSYVYIRTQYQMYITSDWVTFTELTLPSHSGAAEINWIAADSQYLYVAAVDGIWTCSPGQTSTGITQISTSNTDGIWAPGDGRIFASQGNTLYDITNLISAHPQAVSGGWTIFQHYNPNWVWTTVVIGEGAYYYSGRVEVNGIVSPNVQVQVFQSQINDPLTAAQAQSSSPQLNYGVPALTMPVGEFVNAIYCYLNSIFIGSNLGVRMCRTVSADDPSGPTGSIIAGPLLPNLLQPMVNGGCTGFIGHGRFVYFVWSVYEDIQGLTASGLGRMDLETLIDTLTPAYASDVMLPEADWGADTDGYVFWVDWDPITNGPMISYANLGVYVQDAANLVASGWIDSGRITYNIPDPKVVAMGQIRRDPAGAGTVTMAIQTDGGGYNAATPLSPVDTSSLTPTLFTSGGYNPAGGPDGLFRGEEINVQTILTRSSGAPSTGPVLYRETLKSLAAVVSGTTISAVINLYEDVASRGGPPRRFLPYDDYLYLENLRLTQTPVYYREGTKNGDQATPATGYTAVVVVDEIDWLPFDEQYSSDYGFRGDLVVYLRTLVG
jgi:hypothetical protein